MQFVVWKVLLYTLLAVIDFSNTACPLSEHGRWIKSDVGSCSFTNATCGYIFQKNWMWLDEPYVWVDHRSEGLRNRTIIPSGVGDDGYAVLDGFDMFHNFTGYTIEGTFLQSPVLSPGNYCLSFHYSLFGYDPILDVFANIGGKHATLFSSRGLHSNYYWTDFNSTDLYFSSNVDSDILFSSITNPVPRRQSLAAVDEIVLYVEALVPVPMTSPLPDATKEPSTHPNISAPTNANVAQQHTYNKYSTVPTVAMTPSSRSTASNSHKTTIIKTSTEAQNLSASTAPLSLLSSATKALVALQLENVVHLGCTTTNWNITIDMRALKLRYPHASPYNVYLGTNTCRGTLVDNTLIFQHGLQECLTVETVRDGAIIHENDLYYAIYDPILPFIIREHQWTFSIECDVMRNEITSSHVLHNAEHHHVSVSAHYDINLAFYMDPNFQTKIPGNPLHVNVGDTVYVKVYTTAADWTIKLKLDTCYTKPFQGALDSLTYYLIKHGCEVDANTHIMSQSTHETTFLFQDFEYAANHQGLDISCNATFCKTSDYSPQCMQACVGNP